jgi:type IV pilus assembly protein PilQ
VKPSSSRLLRCLLWLLLVPMGLRSATPDSTAARADSATIVQELPQGARDTTSLNFKDADLRDVFRALAMQHGLNVFLDNSVIKRTSITLSRVQVYDALKFLADQHKLLLSLDGGIFRITLPPPDAPPPPPPPRVPYVGFEKGLLSVQLKDDDIEKVILEIEKKSGRNILLISGTTGTLSGKLMDVDFDIALTQILNNNGFAAQKRNGIYVVSRLEYYVGTQGTASQAKSGPYWIGVKDSVVSLDVTNAPLDRVITDLTRQLNTDVVFYNQVAGSVTARATSVPLLRALDLILRNTPYTFRTSDGIYFVGEKANKALTSTRLLKLKYLIADQILELIPQSISTQAILKVMKEHNGVVAIGPEDVIKQLEEYFREIDRPVAQVLIEALVVDYDLTRGIDFGIQAGLTGGKDTAGYTRAGSIFPGIDLDLRGDYLNKKLSQAGTVNILGTDFNLGKLAKLPSDFYLKVKAMEEKGLANVKSHPILATLNGHKATLSIGTTQYFLLKTSTPYLNQSQTVFQQSEAFQTIEADVKLEITPFVGADGQITVEIKPDFRTPVGALSAEVPPTINRRAMSSTLIMRPGETIVLGGLMQESEGESRTQVPLLGSIPLIGTLFSSTSKNTRKAELMIYVTPHVSYGEAFKTALLNPEDDH